MASAIVIFLKEWKNTQLYIENVPALVWAVFRRIRMENVLAVTSTAPLDRTKPLVKDFFDRDAEIKRYLEIRLPHVANYSKMDIIKLFSSKDKRSHTYRVNWFREIPDQIVSKTEFAHHCQIVITTTKDGAVLDHTIIADK